MKKSADTFPIKQQGIYLNHCGISPLYSGAVQAAHSFIQNHSCLGIGIISKYKDILGDLHRSVAGFLCTSKENISFIRNTAEGLCMLAEAFPFQKGDEIISYVHEYPSNHYPWLLQKRRGVKLRLLGNEDLSKGAIAGTKPCAWSLQELERNINSRTRMVALSHVQFTSGFAADLASIGKICQERQVHLVIDAAQSLGALPIFPEKWGIDVVASSGWKWLLGPIGSGLLYTSPALREKLDFCMAGADLMEQGEDYLNLDWKPYLDGRRFEYSTASYELAVQLLACFDEIFTFYGIEKINHEIRKLQQLFLNEIDKKHYNHLDFSPENSSGILSFIVANGDPTDIATKAAKSGLVVSARGGYLRIGIHFYNTEEEVRQAASILNQL